MTTSYLTTSDISAALVGAGFSSVYGLSTPPMQALASLVISIVSRIASQSAVMQNNMKNMNASQKNQFIVGVLSGVYGYYRNSRTNILKSILTGVSVDLIGQEILKTFNFEDSVIVGSTS